MKKIIFFLLLASSLIAREKGQTEITTDGGIEVFQKEKYYLLKKNVKIISDDFILTADQVKAFFEKDLYDIQNIESEGNVKFISTKGSKVSGDKLFFSSLNSNMLVSGLNSSLKMENLEMQSDEFIQIDDLSGSFVLKGSSSILKTKDLTIVGDYIEGEYQKVDSKNEIIKLNVLDENLTEITTDNLKMYSSKALYSQKNNIIELFDNVKVIRENETIIGDYAKINTLDESYKVKSNKSNKVKILINNNE